MAQAIPIHITRFPHSYTFLSDALPKASQDATIWSAFVTESTLSAADAQAATNWGTAPWVFASPLGTSRWGQFDEDNPGRVEVSIDVLNQFEATPDDPAAQQFLLGKVMHELCHWGCFRDSVDEDTMGGEVGESFEEAAFGQILAPWWNAAPEAAQPAAIVAAGGPAPATAAVDPTVFTDPQVRAAACLQLKDGMTHVPGRMADPAHLCRSGDDVAEPLSRGIRNNNPGNLRLSADAWHGLARRDQMTDFQLRETAFFVFVEPEWGMRAMISLLRTYKHVHNLVTPRGIIQRYAPASDNNDVNSYASAMAAGLGIGVDDVADADDPAQVIKMIRAMILHENGAVIQYPDVQYNAALDLL